MKNVKRNRIYCQSLQNKIFENYGIIYEEQKYVCLKTINEIIFVSFFCSYGYEYWVMLGWCGHGSVTGECGQCVPYKCIQIIYSCILTTVGEVPVYFRKVMYNLYCSIWMSGKSESRPHMRWLIDSTSIYWVWNEIMKNLTGYPES